MAMGAPPYSHLPPYPAMLQITQQESANVPDDQFSAELRDFIAQCLTKDVKKRPRIQELAKHPFLEKAQKTSQLMALIQQHKSPNIHNSDTEDSEFESDQFSEQKNDFNALTRGISAKTGSNKKKRGIHRQRDVSVEWTFGTAASGGMVTPRPYTPDVDYVDEEEENPFNHASTKYLMPGASTSNVHKRNSMNLGAYQDEYGPMTDDDDDLDDDFDGGTFLRDDDDEHKIKLEEAANQLNKHKKNNKGKNGWDASDEFDIGFDYKKIRLSMKQGTNALLPKPRLKNDVTSVVSYSIGVQTEDTETFDQQTQTQTQTVESSQECNNNNKSDTVSDLVGVYKDMDDLFNLLTSHVDEDGLEHLESLREKVKKLTHMKITERRQSSHESANSIKIARDRIQQIRKRRATLKEKHSKMKQVDKNEND